MKTQFVTLGMLIATLATATAFADDAQNGQMGQNQPAAASTAQQNQNSPSTDPATAGNADAAPATNSSQAAPQGN